MPNTQFRIPSNISYSTNKKPITVVATRPITIVTNVVPSTDITETNGLDAYQLAKIHGFVGTVEQWLASLVGPKGAMGLTGAVGAIKSYAFIQELPLSAWVVNHNLGYNPVGNYFDEEGDTIMGEIEYIDLNNLIILYSKKVSGKAFFS